MERRDRLFSLFRRLQAAQLRLAMTALVVMMMVTVADVFCRYAFSMPILGSYDIVECALVVFVFHGAASVFLFRRNIVIDLIDSFVGEHVVRVLIRLSDILAIACLAVIAWAMVGPALEAYEYGDVKLEIELPVYLLWIVALIGIAGTILAAIGTLIGRVFASDRSSEQPS